MITPPVAGLKPGENGRRGVFERIAPFVIRIPGVVGVVLVVALSRVTLIPIVHEPLNVACSCSPGY